MAITMKDTRNSLNFLLIVLLAVLILIPFLDNTNVWVDLTFHTFLETAGAVMAIVMAMLFYYQVSDHRPNRSSVIMGSFLSMGILDGMHAIAAPGDSFVFLHTIASVYGGFFLILLWSKSLVNYLGDRKETVAVVVVVISIMTGLFGLFGGSYLPDMVDHNGYFTLTAIAFNQLAAALFFLGSTRLYLNYRASRSIESMFFAVVGVFFGSAKLIFQYSFMWSDDWWVWHFIRLAAYTIIIFYTISRYRSTLLSFRRSIQRRIQTEESLQKEIIDNEITRQALEESEARFREAFEAAENANKAKSVFLANMSHELRTPLNSILGFSELLQRETNLSDVQKENLAIILRSGRHLLSMINDVLDMSTIDAGKVEISSDAFKLPNVIEEVTSMMMIRAEDKGLKFIVELDDDLIQFIKTDLKKLRQILINLLSNAIKYTDEGGIVLRARSGQSVDNKINLFVEVEDSGRGIPKKDFKKIFLPFNQTISSRGVTEGSGLGLSITRSFVELMGGELHVNSEPGTGTIFSFSLPIDIARPDEVPSETVPDRVVGLSPGQQEFRILVVDDEEHNRVLLSRLLDSVGFPVIDAHDGADAVDRFLSFKPHFIWMDIRMPVMDGMEAARRIKAMPEGENCIIVAVTASAFESERNKIIEAGCTDFLRKPYREEEIFNMMEKHLRVRFDRMVMDSNQKPSPILKGDKLIQELKSISGDVLSRLHSACIRGSGKDITDILENISKTNDPLYHALRKHSHSFDYKEIVDLIDTIRIPDEN